ncbi:hypothetical protein I4U23_005391 [Adineta vaga]|nr:hypothetical protein I4U23_005391 [Adineta vaga]
MILFCTGVILCLTEQTTLILLKHPTQKQFQLLPKDAKCSCSQISIPYGKFTTLNTTFHQVCSSDFVTHRWFQATNFNTNSTYLLNSDFRTYGSAQFQSLAGFCRLSKANIDQSILFFYSNTLLSSVVLSEYVLHSQTQSSIKQFQLRTPNNFNSQLRLINQMIINNQILSALQTNFWRMYSSFADTVNIRVLPRFYKRDNDRCYCSMYVCDKTASGIFNTDNNSNLNEPSNILWTLPGILAGCLPVQSILVSTLECFYNQTCLNKLMSYISVNESFQVMNISQSTLYTSNTTIQSIVNNFMTEDWIINISYDKYYLECSPSLCTYFQTSRRTFVHILTKLISLLASLVLILRLIFSFIIHFIYRLQDSTPKPKISFYIRLCQWKESIRKKLIEFNMFNYNSNVVQHIRYQCYATRLYIVLIIILMLILTVYNATKRSIQSKTILNPTQSQYIQLYQQYPHTFICPCSSISMSYSTFITIEPQYHQLCSSYFISTQWMDYIEMISGNIFVSDNDYRMNAPFHFNSLAMFCQQAKQSINESSETFLQTKFVTSQLLSQQTFQSQINSLFEDWKLGTMNTFIRMIQLVRTTTKGNQLSTIHNTETSVNITSRNVIIKPSFYSTCNCALSPSCRRNIIFYDRNTSVILHSVPNFFIGCYPIEALFASTLECFYNLSCILKTNSYLLSSKTFNNSSLDENLNNPNEIIEMIINRLMVDKWITNLSFSSYYNQCASLSCTYQYEDRNNRYVIISVSVFIYGSLSLGLKLIILIGLHFIDTITLFSVSHHTLFQFFKRIFICKMENQLIHRLHVILVATTLSILYMYSTLTPQVTNIEIQKPSLFMYEKLMKQSFDSIECSCSQISIKYKTFLNLTSHFHQLCSSDLVSNLTSSYFYNYTLSNPVSPSDFLYSAYVQFQLLTSFCQLSKQTVEDSLIQLGISDFISTHLLSATLLNNQIQKIINDFQITMPKLFFNTLSLIREITGANMLLNVLSTNWIIDTPSKILDRLSIDNIPLNYNGCSCALSSKCVSPSRGMLAGCYPLESILQSTTECFYDKNCTNQLVDINAINISILSSSRFPLNSTIESIINELMIENLTSSLSYESYFNQCAPLSCIYSYVDNSNIIEGIITLIGLYGGLVIICRLIAILILKQILRRTFKITPS